MIIYLDCETIGLNGNTMLIQYSLDQHSVQFIHVWKLYKEYDLKILKQIEILYDQLKNSENTIIGFNLSFDLYHLYRVIHQFFYDENLDSVVRPCEPFR